MTDWAGFAWFLILLICSCIVDIVSVYWALMFSCVSACVFQCFICRFSEKEHGGTSNRGEQWNAVLIIFKSEIEIHHHSSFVFSVRNSVSSMFITFDYRRSKQQKRKPEIRRIERCVKPEALGHLAWKLVVWYKMSCSQIF